jgi:hypothetical protein
MAELIEKGKLLKALATSREYHAASCREQNLLIRAEIIVREQPTVTEAEIREKAYADFVEHITLPLTTEEDIAQILEQLKGE